MLGDDLNPFRCMFIRVWDRRPLQPLPDMRIIQNRRETLRVGETWRGNNDVFIGLGKTEKRFRRCRVNLKRV